MNAIKLLESASCLNLRDFPWSDLALVGLPNSFKHFMNWENFLTITRHYTLEMMWKFLQVSDRIMASWTADDGSIDTTKARRP
ncbi:hypothetical protein P5673_020509 [Acropora cervicornis]|uniref:Uncharacterized protein n=1 Tax=Acropora cervicornis TaxID=6130 RepID=A0AAD9Q9V3_ACRCE|nr:hypothetical protein P5673_020509 [Acropora cervicornis]